MRRHRILLWVAVALVPLIAVAIVVIVGGGGDDVRSRAPGSTGAPSTGSQVGLIPLLGIPGSGPQRAALAVKIENTEAGRPPTGLVQADVVFEEVVEGGLTRLLAVFQSQDPATVGPVRSARSTDILILAELGRPLFAWSGANPTFRAAVQAADIVDVGVAAAGGAYWRDRDRRAPYNLYAAPEDLRAAAMSTDPDAARLAPAPLFSYRPEGEPLSGPGVTEAASYQAGPTPARGLSTSIWWGWDARRSTWVRTQNGIPHVDSAGDRVTAANVLIRSTPYRDSGIRDSTGAVVPEAAMVGQGDVLLLSAGRAQPGRWHKPAPGAPTTYTALDGSPLLLAPGPTWVEVLPPGTGALA